MSIANLSSISSWFKGNTTQDPDRMFKEVLLMTLARASRADSNIASVEVDTIRSVMKQVSGEDVDASEVRIAAGSEIFETTSLEAALARVRDSLDVHARAKIVESLGSVIRSDVKVTSTEVAFFNKVAAALKITPAELAGLIP